MKAVTDTKGKVVVDDNLNFIDAAFHSNSEAKQQTLKMFGK